MVGGVWRPQPHGAEFSTCMADLRRRAVAPIGPVRGPLCALRQRRARFDGRKGARWPRFAIVAVLRTPVRTDSTIFSCARNTRGQCCVRMPRLGVRGATSPMRSTGRNHRARRPLAPSPSRFERSRASPDRQQTPAASARLLPPSCGPFRRHGRCCRCAAPHQYGSELGLLCPGKGSASERLRRPLLASAFDLPVQRPHGSEARVANKTRPCSFKRAEVAYWYVPAVRAQPGIKTCAFGW